MTLYGPNLDPLNAAGRPDPRDLAAYGFTSVRLVSRPGVDDYVAACRDAGLDVLGVLARESDGYVCRDLSRLQCGNEADHVSDSSWTLSPDDYVALWQQLRGEHPNIPLIAAGLASGDPAWWAAVWPQIEFDGCEGASIHPYGQRPERDWPAPDWGFGYVGDLLDRYRAVSPGLPIYVTEYGANSAEVGLDFQAEYLARMTRTLAAQLDVAGAWVFAWSDLMHGDFGLIDSNGSPKPSFYALQEALQMPTLDERIAQLQAQQALQTLALRRLLEGALEGADGAAGAVVALEGGQTSVEVRLGKF